MACRYAIFSAHYAPHMGGIEQFTERLARELVAGGDRVDVVTSCYEGLPARERPAEGIELWRLPSRMLLDGRLPLARRNAEFRAMLAELAQIRYDGVLVNARYYDLCLEGVRFARAQGLRAVLLDHSSAPIGFGIPALDVAVRLYERERTRRVRRFDPAFYGVSEGSVLWLRSLGLDPRGTIHNAIDAPEFRRLSSGRDFRAELGVAPEVPVVSFVGRLVGGKGADVLCEVARRMEASGASAAFLVAGDGPLLERLRTEAPVSCYLLGRLSKPDVSALLSQSDVFCFPSTYPEGLPTTLLEAAAWGVAIVSTDVAGARDVMPDDGCGKVVGEATPECFQEAVCDLLRDRDRARRMGAAVQARVEAELTWTQTATAARAAMSGERSPKKGPNH